MNVPLIVIGIISVVTIAAVILYLYTKQHEHFATTSPAIKIMSADETAAFLKEDADGYVQNMSIYDLRARHAESHTEYINRAVAAAHNVTKSDARRIMDAVRNVDKYIASKTPSLLHVPWNIAVTKGQGYEDGYPHTRKDTIFISASLIGSDELASTLLHEKVHVYQRMYPQEMDKWLIARGFTRWKTRVSEPLVRANPDLDAWIYIDDRTQKPMIAIYNSEHPSSISDVKLTNIAFEHPYELMAYEIADNFVLI